MSPTLRDRLGSALLLAFIAVLWVQRDYSSPFGGLFPDTIMAIMTVFVVLTLILSFTRYAAMPNKTKPGADNEQMGAARKHVRRVVVVAVVLAVWVGLYRPVGFALTGTLGFAAIAWYLGDHRNGMRGALKAISIGALVCFVIYMVFDYSLGVPLPPGFLFD